MASIEIFAIINFLLALFVLVFASFYLRHVWNSKSRNAWLLLFIAVLVLFVLQSANLLSVAGYFSMSSLRWIFDLVFLVVLLFVFVFQYYLLYCSEKYHKIKKKSTKK